MTLNLNLDVCGVKTTFKDWLSTGAFFPLVIILLVYFTKDGEQKVHSIPNFRLFAKMQVEFSVKMKLNSQNFHWNLNKNSTNALGTMMCSLQLKFS